MAGDGADLAYIAGEMEDPRVVTVIEGAQAHGVADREEPPCVAVHPKWQRQNAHASRRHSPTPTAIGGQGSTPRHCLSSMELTKDQ
jgi:hypothetical protein